jgi:hypothetical protein
MSQITTSDAPRKKLPLVILPPRRTFGQTSRKDAWWLTPILVVLGLGAFIVYSTWAAFQNNYYWVDNYLSPMYAPELFGKSPHAWFGPQPPWWPAIIPFSPAFLILWAPGGFRFTCYYYRGAYYKAFWADPSSCAVGEPRKKFLGENSFPLILQNIHRYFFYIAAIFIALLAYDVYLAMWFHDPADAGRIVRTANPSHEGPAHFGIGVGTLLLALNTYLLGSYTFGCHSFRHLMGGFKDEVSKSATKKVYDCASCLNRKHMLYAWCSLFTVGFSDVYIRLCSMGIWQDWHWRIS